MILVYPLREGQAYQQTAVYVRQKSLPCAVPGRGSRCVALSGKGFDYSGAGSTPRAIFQFNRGANRCTLEGFDLAARHNDSHNGAGVRINQANHVTLRDCAIHDNDMGVMSNGDGSLSTRRQPADRAVPDLPQRRPGRARQNHNLYLGGTSVTLRFCEVFGSLTGHNVKSRAHHTRVEYCYVHDSANRELDLVDAAETARPQSHAVLLGQHHRQGPAVRGQPRGDPLRPRRRQRARRHALPGLQHDRHPLRRAGRGTFRS